MQSNTNLKFEKLPVFGTDKEIYCDISTGKPRPYVTKSFRKVIFSSIHNLCHPGARATAHLVSKKFVWPSMNKDVKEFTKTCLSCQRSKIQRHVHKPVGEYLPTSKRFDEIYLDIIGPLITSEGQRYCITLIDRFTRWPEAIPVPDIKANTVAEAVYNGWISRFGTPSVIVTDQGSQFESSLFTELARLLGIKRKRTTSYNPACNGFIERWHRTLKNSIKCHNNSQWTKVLSSVLLGLRSTFREEFQTTPAELVYGSNLRLPSDFLHESQVSTDISTFAEKSYFC